MQKIKHCCWNVKKLDERSICRECGEEGKSVKEVTLKSLVKKSKIETIKELQKFFFCESPSCEVVYFNNDENVYLFKEDVKVRVGIKERKDPISVCYCFGWTREKILTQIEERGKSTAFEEISAKRRLGECACEIKNPSGRCCLKEVKRFVEEGLKIYEENE